jgi:outer membrane lipoprotein carrier protein
MKRWLTLLAVLSMGLSAAPASDLTTREVLLAVQEQYGKIRSLTADFTQQTTNKMLDQTITAQGKAYFQKVGRMRWEYTTAPKNIWVSDGETLWLYQPEENQVVVERVDAERSGFFLAFLAGESDLTRDFEIHRLDQEVEEAGDGYRIELTPKTPHAIMHRLILTVDRRTGYVSQADIYDAYDNLTRTDFKHIRTHRELPQDLFTFEIPPGTEVIENPGLSP